MLSEIYFSLYVLINQIYSVYVCVFFVQCFLHNHLKSLFKDESFQLTRREGQRFWLKNNSNFRLFIRWISWQKPVYMHRNPCKTALLVNSYPMQNTTPCKTSPENTTRSLPRSFRTIVRLYPPEGTLQSRTQWGPFDGLSFLLYQERLFGPFVSVFRFRNGNLRF